MQPNNKIRKGMIFIAIAIVVTIISTLGSKKQTEETQVKAESITYNNTPRMTAGVATVLEGTDAETEKTICALPVQSLRLTSDEAYLLAKIAMAEAEGEDAEGKALVILTVLNRVRSNQFPDTIEEVIYQKNAFTPISDGRWDRVEPDADCWEALRMVQDKHWDESCGALYFECTTDKSTWHSRNLEELFKHGNHTFYKE